jgi:hypothetical protein
MMSKQYVISRAVLEHLLTNNFKYVTLCLYGEDGYAHGERFELMRAMVELPWNAGRSIDDMAAIIDKEKYSVEQLVSDQIEVFWEEYDNHKLADDDESAICKEEE